MYFAVEETNELDAINLVNNWFNNVNGVTPLLIEVVEIPTPGAPPEDYYPGTFDTFSFVYGIGGERGHDNLSLVMNLHCH